MAINKQRACKQQLACVQQADIAAQDCCTTAEPSGVRRSTMDEDVGIIPERAKRIRKMSDLRKQIEARFAKLKQLCGVEWMYAVNDADMNCDGVASEALLGLCDELHLRRTVFGYLLLAETKSKAA